MEQIDYNDLRNSPASEGLKLNRLPEGVVIQRLGPVFLRKEDLDVMLSRMFDLFYQGEAGIVDTHSARPMSANIGPDAIVHQGEECEFWNAIQEAHRKFDHSASLIGAHLASTYMPLFTYHLSDFLVGNPDGGEDPGALVNQAKPEFLRILARATGTFILVGQAYYEALTAGDNLVREQVRAFVLHAADMKVFEQEGHWYNQYIGLLEDDILAELADTLAVDRERQEMAVMSETASTVAASITMIMSCFGHVGSPLSSRDMVTFAREVRGVLERSRDPLASLSILGLTLDKFHQFCDAAEFPDRLVDWVAHVAPLDQWDNEGASEYVLNQLIECSLTDPDATEQE
jgi:hypothetical protein